MKKAHARVLGYLRRGGTARAFHGQKVCYVSVWVSIGRYDTYEARRTTLHEMEEMGLVQAIERWVGDGMACDVEFVLPNTQGASHD